MRSETGHNPAEITSRRSICCVPTYKKYVPMQQMLRRDVFLWLFSSLHEILLVFVFEVRSENTLADVFADFILGPESATGQFFLARFHLAIIYTAMYINQFLFPLTLKDIMPKRFRFKIGDTQFFPYLAMQCLTHTFA